MNRPLIVFLSACLALAAQASPGRAQGRGTVDSAAEALDAIAGLQIRAIPPALLQDAQGVAIIPNVIKAGFVLGGRYGQGVILVRQPDGSWSNPVFISMTGGSIGWQVGIQSTDVVLVFKTKNSLDRIFQGKGKLTLGVDAAVAAGPIGRQAEAGTDAMLKAEIFSYSRSRGLFVGLSLEGAGLCVENRDTNAYYRLQNAGIGDILAMRGPMPAEVEKLKATLARLTSAPPPLQFQPIPAFPPPPLPPPTPIPPPPLGPPRIQ